MSTDFASATASHEPRHQFPFADSVLSRRTQRVAELRVNQIRDVMNFDQIVGNSRALRDVLALVEIVASWNSTVLLPGETGTGEELVAQAIYRHSDRSDRALIKANCVDLPGELVSSVLFGHEKGAFTGANQQRIGRFEAANGGTIFLDEIAELSPRIQVALLRVLQEKEFERAGANRTIKTDMHVIAATNKDPRHEVGVGRFRMDLFYINSNETRARYP